ncbi:MAG: putative competence protein ComEA [Actinomycetota bacterium]|jgi:competence protein ComEA
MDRWRPEPPDDEESLWSRVVSWVRFVGPLKVAASAIGIVVAGSIGWMLVRPSQPGAEATLGTLAPSTAAIGVGSTDSTVPSDSSVTVHVAGAVMTPGVYEVDLGARVVDAVAAAGGPLPRAATDAVNLAAPVTDGERIYLPAVGEVADPVTMATASNVTGSTSTTLLNVNTATAEQLDALPGVGPPTAAAIIARRDEIGRFVGYEDLLSVPGIGPAKVDAWRGLLTF